ncbi:MAG: CPBP family intramembrane glutamic endopeptidase [Promethearchaeota archaeon]
MMEKEKSTKTKIIEDRLYFFIELVIVFIGGFFLVFIAEIITSILDPSSILYGPLYFLIKSIIILVTVPLFLHLAYLILKDQKEENQEKFQLSPTFGHLKLYTISRNNFKYQFLYGFLILFLIFIPLDFFTYLIPGMIEYQAESLINPYNSLGTYFTQSYEIFIASAIIIHISVALMEETLARGLIAKRGSEYYNKISAVIISSIYWGMGHLFYVIFNPIQWGFSIIWFLQAFFIGIILSSFIIKKKWLFPLIFAHALNNIISAHTIWNYKQGNNFLVITIYLYVPLLIISILLLIWQFSRIKTAVSTGFKEFISYFKPDSKRNESGGDLGIRILFDIIMGIIIFLLGLLVSL